MSNKSPKSERKRLVDKLDKITSEIIKIRDENTCQRCGSKPRPKGCHWAHIFSRSKHFIRWDFLNSIVLCNGCHRFWHANPLSSQIWFEAKFPHRYNYLQIEIQKTVRQIPTSELQDLYESHKQKLKELQAEVLWLTLRRGSVTIK